MSNFLEVVVLVEGQTEQKFVNDVLAPYMAVKGIYMIPIIISKKGQKGGDVKFQRVKTDICNHLKQRNNTIISTFVDYYGLSEWPDKDKIKVHDTPEQIAHTLNSAAQKAIAEACENKNVRGRFIPFMAVHEFEALLFSDSEILSSYLSIYKSEVDKVIEECGSPEKINNSPQTAPSKRLERWARGRYGKTTSGIVIAKAIGIDKMRNQCPLFNLWLSKLESLASCSIL